MLRRIIDHLSKKKKFERIAKANGLNLDYSSNKSSIDLLHSIFILREYADYFPFYQKVVVVDVGAHKGYFTLFAALNSNVESRIISVEPVRSNFEILEQNVRLNKNENENITLIKAAVAAFEGPIDIHLSHDTNHSLISGNPLSGKSDSTEKVKAFTLDSLISQYQLAEIDFLKMDCEGAEYDILFNASSTTLRRIKILSLEFHDLKDPNNSALKLIEFMESQKFETVKFQYEPSNMGLNYGKLIFKRINLE